MVKKAIPQGKNISQNRKALFNYEIVEKFEAGIVLVGSEVKTLRMGTVSLQESYVATDKNGDVDLINCFIEDYKFTSKHLKHDSKRNKRLLLKRREIVKLSNGIAKKGFTAVPLRMYFNNRGLVKLEIALVKGKSGIDKRQTIKERDWKRDQMRTIKQYNVKC